MSIKNSNQTTPNNYRTSYLHSKKNIQKRQNHSILQKKDTIKMKKKYLQIKKILLQEKMIMNRKLFMKMNIKI